MLVRSINGSYCRAPVELRDGLHQCFLVHRGTYAIHAQWGSQSNYTNGKAMSRHSIYNGLIKHK